MTSAFNPSQLITEFDRALRAMTGTTQAYRPCPQPAEPNQAALSEAERRHAAGLMRINHVGEVCAQALYQAQKLAAHTPEVRTKMAHAAQEEEDHLAWCAERLRALNDRPSLLNPLWFAGAFALGLVAGRAGDAVSLGFVSETERQVEHHLDGHLAALPAQDGASRAILEQMRTDEIAHGEMARQAGGIELPAPVRGAMRLMAKVMTTTAYRI